MAKLVRKLLLLVASFLALVVVASPPAAAAGYDIKLWNYNSGLCLDTVDQFDLTLRQNHCADATNVRMEFVQEVWGMQIWQFRVLEGSHFNCVTASVNAGSAAMQTICGNAPFTDQQWWVLQYRENNMFRLVNPYTGFCLGIPGGSTAPGAPVIGWHCGEWADHKWLNLNPT